MKASHDLLIKAAELGIMRSLQDFLAEPLKPGRLRGRFMEIEFIIDSELKKLYANNPNLYTDNLQEITVYLEKFGKIMNIGGLAKKDLHIASVVCFCLSFLEETKTNYTPKLIEYLKDVLDYYERVDNIVYGDYMKGRNFYEEWEKLNNG